MSTFGTDEPQGQPTGWNMQEKIWCRNKRLRTTRRELFRQVQGWVDTKTGKVVMFSRGARVFGRK